MLRKRYAKKIIKIIVPSFLVLFLAPVMTLAHQPRITETRLTQVPDPEISKAYYGKLSGEPDVYIIEASKAFNFYVNVLVPDIAGQKKDVSAVVLKDNKQIAALDGVNFEWKQFYEPFGADTYWMGPEYKARAEAGTYEIRVWSSNNDSKYSLAIGEIEAFDFKESMNALRIIPKLKKNFFDESPIGFIVSPFGWGLIVIMYVLAFVVGFVLKFFMKKFSNPLTSPAGSLAKKGRLVRFIIGMALLLWAILTSWNPIIIFISGFLVFEALFSWCALNQMIKSHEG